MKDYGAKVGDRMKGLDAVLGGVDKVGKDLVELGKKALDFGKYVVNAVEIKKQTFAGLDALEGSARMAEAARKTLELMANNAGKDVGSLVEKFDRMVAAGKVTADEGVAAILDTIHDRFDKGQGLGALAKQLGSGSVTAAPGP